MGRTGLVRRIAALVLMVWAVPAAAAEPVPLEAYGDLPGVEQAAISPSGRGLAMVGRIQGKRQLVVLDADRKVRRLIPASDAKIRDLRWVGEEEVLLITSVTEKLDPIFIAARAEIFGALVVPLDGREPWLVFSNTAVMANMITADLGTRFIGGKWEGFFSGIEFANSKIGNSIVGSTGVLRAVDLKSKSTRNVATSSSSNVFREWLIDEHGRPVVNFEITTERGRWKISNDRGTELVSGVNTTGTVELLCLGHEGKTVIYANEDDTTGEVHWYEIPLEGGAAKEVLANVNVDRLYIDRTNGRLLGYLEGGTTPRSHFFDAGRQAAAEKVMAAFPGLQVQLADWTPDFSHMLVRTSGNADSGTWYLVDLANRRADPVGTERPLILPERVGPISRLSYRAADGLELDGILTLPPGREARNLPIILLPHGGPTSEDRLDFDWWAQAFASRGYAVFQPNFRGSTNRDDAFRRAGYGEWGRKMQTDLSDGLAELARRGIVNPERACIMGGSYGGYAALAGVTLQQGIYRCAVSVAGVSDLRDLYSTRVRETGHRKTVWRAMRESMGHPSTFDDVSPRKHADRADAPILLIHGKDDVVVPYDHSSAMASALRSAGKPYELVALKEEDHWLSRAETRKQMLAEAMHFVQQHNPAD